MLHSPFASVSRPSRFMIVAGALAALAVESPAQIPTGGWTPVYDWSCQFSCPPATTLPVEFSHAALIPTGAHRGNVLLWRLDCNTTTPVTTETWIFDPSSPQYLARVTQTLESEIFCSGLSWDPDGNLIVAGGVGSPFPSQTYRFRPGVLATTTTSPTPCNPPPTVGSTQRPWQTRGLMAVPRYYPTLITLLRRSITNVSTPSIVAGGATLVLGGPWVRPLPPPQLPLPAPQVARTDYGNEWWELLPKGSPTWAAPLFPTAWIPPTHAPAAPGNSEPYNPIQGGVAPTPPQVLLDSYPRVFQLADIVSGPTPVKENILITSDTETAAFNVPTNPGCAWVMRTPLSTGPSQPNWELVSLKQSGAITGGATEERFYGTAVLMHRLGTGGLNRALVFGGSQDSNFQFAYPGTPALTSGNWNVNNTVQELDLSVDPTNQTNLWRSKAPMIHPRVYLNAVALPIGQILLVGGASAYTHPGGNGTPVPIAPVTAPELYDPGAGTAQSGISIPLPTSTLATPRLYHSLATLLPDGSVFVVGGHDLAPGSPPFSEYTGEIYQPYYVGTPANRPAVVSGPSEAGFLPSTIELDYELAPGFTVERVVLLRPAAVTHHFDSDQRYIELAFTPPTPGVDAPLVVTCPREDLGPPGWYMMFLVARDPSTQLLWPSMAHWIRFQ